MRKKKIILWNWYTTLQGDNIINYSFAYFGVSPSKTWHHKNFSQRIQKKIGKRRLYETIKKDVGIKMWEPGEGGELTCNTYFNNFCSRYHIAELKKYITRNELRK